MAAPSVTFDGTRVSSANTVTDGGNWNKWQAAQNPAVEPDFTYEGANSLSNKVGTSAGGVELLSTGTHNLNPGICLFKVIATNSSALNVLGSTGMILSLGSGGGTGYYEYYVQGSDTYPLQGGWVFEGICPAGTASGYRDNTTGTPSAGAIDYFSVDCDFISTSKSENVAIDAIDLLLSGEGLTLIGGDGASDDCTFEDFRVFEEDTSTNRHGILRSVEGIFYVIGYLNIGTATETDFTDATGGTMVFSDGRFVSETSGILIDIQNNSSVFSCTGWSFVGNGNETTTDTRPSVTVSGAGTSASATFTGCAFRNFNDAIFNVDSVVSGCTFTLTKVVDAGDGANLSGSSILESSAAADSHGVLWDNTVDPDGFLDNMTFSKGALAHHAIRFGNTIPSEITINDCDFTGFNATEAQNDSTFYFADTTGTITLNLVGCTSDVSLSASFKTAGCAVVVVEDPVTLTVNTIDSGATAVGSARVFVKASDGTGPLPYQDVVTITAITTTATVAHTSHGLTTGQKVLIEGVVNDEDYNGIKTIIVTTASEYTYTVSTSPASPATGSPISTGVVISALSNGSGVASDTRTYGSDQPITGWSRQTSPYYKEGAISGTISFTDGLITNAVMILDE